MTRELRSESLDLLRFPLAVVVVIVHLVVAEGFVIQGQLVNVADSPFFELIYRFVDAFLRGQSVPIYFFISGYVFFVGVELTRERYFQKLKNRVKTLLIPYMVWNTLAIGMLFMKLLPCLSHFLPSAYTLNFSWKGLLSCYWMYDQTLIPDPTTHSYISNNYLAPIDVPLWFVRDLMIVVLFTPLLYWVMQRTKFYMVVLIGILWFVTGYTDLDYLHTLSTAFFFFSLGAYMSINRKDMFQVFGQYFHLSIALYISLGVLYFVSACYFPEILIAVKQLNICVGLVLAYNLSAWLLKKGVCHVNPFLASASFFIYVAHLFIGLKLTRFLYVFLSPSSSMGILGINIVSIVLNILILLSIYYLLQRYCPSVLRVLTGRKALIG